MTNSLRHLSFTLVFLIGNLFFFDTGYCERSAFDGNNIAISLSIDSEPLTPRQIDLLRRSGVSLIELSDPAQIPFFGDDFYFIAGPVNRFVLPSEFSNSYSQLIRSALDDIQQFQVRAPGRVVSYNLLYYPYDADTSFFSLFEKMADSIRTETDLPLFYRSYLKSFPEEHRPVDYISLRYPAVLMPETASNPIYYFDPGSDNLLNLSSLELLLNQMVTLDESLILLSDEWFFSIFEELPDFHYILSAHTQGKPIEMIYPHYPPQAEFRINFVLTFTVLLWALLALLFKYRPLFVELFSRYFFNHSFLIADLFDGRLRNRSEAVIMLLLNCLISGFFFYAAATLYFSDISFNMLSYHAPVLFPDGYQPFVFFSAGFLFATLFHLISLAWLALFNKVLRKVPFLLNTYSWPFLLNIFPFTLIVLLTQTERTGWLSTAALVLFFSLYIAAFMISALQGAKHLSKHRVLNFVLTAGFFSSTVFYLLYLLVTSDLIMEPLRLALWVS